MHRASRQLLPTLAILTLLVGCSGSDSPAQGDAGTATPSDSPTSSAPSTSTTDSVQTQSELDEAIAALPSPSNFTFTLSINDPKPFFDTRGTYFTGKRWQAVTDIRSPETADSAAMTTIAIGTQMWFQMDNWKYPNSVCWVSVVAGNVPAGMQFMARPMPVPYLLLDGLTVTDDGYFAPFGAAAKLMTVETTEEAGWNAQLGSTEPVPVTVEFEDGLVSRVIVLGTDLLGTIAASKKADPGIVDAIADMRVEMTFAEGTDYLADPPPPYRVVPEGADGCH